jgi:hypothetical protein
MFWKLRLEIGFKGERKKETNKQRERERKRERKKESSYTSQRFCKEKQLRPTKVKQMENNIEVREK